MASRYALDLFVVHATADSGFVHGYLIPALNVPPSRRLLLDELSPGAVVVSEIERGVSSSRFTVVVLSPECLADSWAVFGETLASCLSVADTHVIPLKLADCELPIRLQARVALDFTDRAHWDAQAAQLRKLLHTQTPLLGQIPCPYPGIRPFDESEAGQFSGRDRELDDLVERIDRGEREIYLIGPSGSGKSSLVRAGLMHELKHGSRLGGCFAVREVRPGEHPTDRLEDALEGDLAAPAATVTGFLARHAPARRVLVFIDQFEELFTLAGSGERQRFVAVIGALRAEPRCTLVLALRADFFGALMDSALWPDLAGRISRIEVAPLRGAALARAITEPAMRAGVHLELRLCDRLVADAYGEPGALPLVQETLRILWSKRRHRLLGLAEYLAIGDGGGGLHVAIARHADATMRELTLAEQAIARRILLRLVSFGEGRPDTRRQAEVDALRSAADDSAVFSRVLQHLVSTRLVTIQTAGGNTGALADLSHEALITAWPALREWIASRRADEQQRRRLDAKVAEWIDRGRGAARLLDASELAEATQWMTSDAARELGYKPGLPELVAASQSAIEEIEVESRERRRFRAMTYLDQGRALLLGGRPMQAIPYLVAARAESIESSVLDMLFAQATRNLPVVSFTGHRAVVRKIAFSPDGSRVVTASWDRTARVWDAASGRPVTPPLVHGNIVVAVAFSPDGTRVVTASKDRTARIWNAATGILVAPSLAHHEDVHVAAFSPDGSQVITASSDRTARIWDAATGAPVTPPLKHQDTVYAAAFSPDGTRVVTASHDRTAQIWNAATGKPVTPPLRHRDGVHAAAFSADGTRVITASYDRTARIWSAATGAPVTAPLAHDSEVVIAAFSPDGTRAVTASLDRAVRLWDASLGTLVTPPLCHHGHISAAVFSPDGKRLVTASHDKTAQIWDAATGRPVTSPLEHHGPVRAAVFSPDGTCVATASEDKVARIWDASRAAATAVALIHRDIVLGAGFRRDGSRVVTASEDGTAQIWDAATGGAVASLVHGGSVHSAAFDPDGARVVTASWDRTAQIWRAATGEPLLPPLGHHGAVWAAAFSPDGARVATASWDTTARIWDASTGAPITPPLEHEGPVQAATFSPDGTRVVTASQDRTARIWDAGSGAPLTPPLVHGDIVCAAVFHPDGTRVVTASADGTARIWDAATGEPVTPPLEHHKAVHTAAFSPDGTRVITASRDGTARIWDAATGKPVTPPLEHLGQVRAAAFSPDGACVVTASWDHTARIWDAGTGKAITPPLEHHAAVNAAAWSPDGSYVVTASRDGTARIWSLLIHGGSLDDWRLIARCSPFALVDNVLTINPDPAPRVPVALRPAYCDPRLSPMPALRQVPHRVASSAALVPRPKLSGPWTWLVTILWLLRRRRQRSPLARQSADRTRYSE